MNHIGAGKFLQHMGESTLCDYEGAAVIKRMNSCFAAATCCSGLSPITVVSAQADHLCDGTGIGQPPL